MRFGDLSASEGSYEAIAAALFLIGILLGLALHVISPATTYSSRNSSTVVVVSVPAATSADGDVLR